MVEILSSKFSGLRVVKNFHFIESCHKMVGWKGSL